MLKRLVRESETLRISLVRHDQIVCAHTQQVAACNALHELEERLSRWLLQTRDLLGSDTLPLTQEFLSQMLGVQRSSVTLVARKLQDAGLIRYRRGRIQVLDVEGLQELVLRVLCGDQRASPSPGWMVARPRRAPRGSGTLNFLYYFALYVGFRRTSGCSPALENRSVRWLGTIFTSRMGRI